MKVCKVRSAWSKSCAQHFFATLGHPSAVAHGLVTGDRLWGSGVPACTAQACNFTEKKPEIGQWWTLLQTRIMVGLHTPVMLVPFSHEYAT